MLEVRDLSVVYGQHRALDGASLRVDPGEIVVILGANGAGKSTLLKSISGICEGKVTGSVTLDGHELVGMPSDAIVEEGVVLVPEGRGVFGDLTVQENLTLGAYSRRARDEEAANLSRVMELFPKLGERRRQVVRTMSGGEQQMVAVGRAIMSNPQILTLDEPSLGLSPLLCKELFQNLAAIRELGIGILLVEQNARQSLAIADRGYLLENAHIVYEESASALMNDPAVQAAYLGAGGAAAPHTHEEDEAVAAVATPDEPALTPITVRPRLVKNISADELLGRPVSDLVAGAVSRQARLVPERAAGKTNGSGGMPSTGHADRLSATIAEIEEAARRARTARTRQVERPMRSTEPREADTKRDSSEEKPSPVTIEIYRAPRVEVYRRRPGTGDMKKD